VETDDRGRPVTVEDAADEGLLEEGELFEERSTASAQRQLPARTRRVDEVLEFWRIDDEWWRTPIVRRYVEVVLQGGGHVVLFEDLTTGQWFLQQP
jgi:hypothetical protein